MVRCCAYGCTADGTHLFPKDDARRKQWEIALKRGGFKSTKHSRLCAAHFKPEDYISESFFTGVTSQRKILNKTAVPSLFSFNKQPSPSIAARGIRLKKGASRRLDFSVKKQKLIEDVLNTTEQAFEDVPDTCAEVEVGLEVIGENEHDTVGEVSSNGTCSVGTQKSFQFFTIGNFKTNDEAVYFYTGLETYDKFKFVFQTLCPEAYSINYRYSQVLNLSVEDQFFLTLIKLKRKKEDLELGSLFDISRTTVSNIFCTWINFMHQMWSMLDVWPSRELVNFYMPDGFKKLYPSTRVIVDCTEVPVEQSNNPATQQACFSNYKNRTTFKVEVVATPSGLLSHCSDAYGGCTSDRQIVERSSLLNKCERGDSIMADRGFNVQDLFACKGVAVNIPTFLKGKAQLPGLTVLQDRKLSSKRVHIERMIGLTKTYKILQGPLKRCYLGIASKIYVCCHMLCNFREGIVSSSA